MALWLILVLAIIVGTTAFGYIADEIARQRAEDAMNDANWRKHE